MGNQKIDDIHPLVRSNANPNAYPIPVAIIPTNRVYKADLCHLEIPNLLLLAPIIKSRIAPMPDEIQK